VSGLALIRADSCLDIVCQSVCIFGIFTAYFSYDLKIKPAMRSQSTCTNPFPPDVEQTSVPPVFCWTKMGSEAGQGLEDILRRKDLERQCGEGLFSWGIGNSVGPAMHYARTAERITELDALFTPMKSAAKALDAAPARLLMWLGYSAVGGHLELLPEHMLVTSRGHFESGEDKRGHYALICRSDQSLSGRTRQGAFDHRAVRNLISSNPVGASQVTSVVRHDSDRSTQATYSVLFRARLTGDWCVRLAAPICLDGELLELYKMVCAARTQDEWRGRIATLKAAAKEQSTFPYQEALPLFH
jgi:hypothetical protein